MLEMKGDYIMKNSKLLIALITPLILSGCGSSKKVSFKEDLKYERELSLAEVASVRQKTIEKMYSDLKSFKETYKYQSIQGHNEYTEDGSYETTFYSDAYFHSVGKSKETEKIDGVALTTNYESNEEVFDYQDRTAIVTYNETKENGKLKNSYFGYGTYTAADADAVRNDFSKDIIENRDMVPFDGNETAYLVKGGTYAFVYSVKNETHNYIGYDDETKDHKAVDEEQRIILIDKNFKVTSMTYYQDYSSNRDDATYEWFKDMKSLYHVEMTRTFDYSKRAASGKLLTKAMDKVAGAYLLAPTVTFEYGNYDVETGTYTKASNISTSSVQKYLYQFSNYHYEMVSSSVSMFDEAYNALKLEVTADAYSAFSAAAETVETLKTNYVFEGFETVTLADGTVIMLVSEPAEYRFVLNMNVTVENRQLVLTTNDYEVQVNKFAI